MGGEFTFAGGLPAGCIAAWDGDHWDTMAGGVSGTALMSGPWLWPTARSVECSTSAAVSRSQEESRPETSHNGTDRLGPRWALVPPSRSTRSFASTTAAARRGTQPNRHESSDSTGLRGPPSGPPFSRPSSRSHPPFTLWRSTTTAAAAGPPSLPEAASETSGTTVLTAWLSGPARSGLRLVALSGSSAVSALMIFDDGQGGGPQTVRQRRGRLRRGPPRAGRGTVERRSLDRHRDRAWTDRSVLARGVRRR